MIGIAIVFYLHGKKCFNPFPWKFPTDTEAMNMVRNLQRENPNVQFCLVDLEGEIKK